MGYALTWRDTNPIYGAHRFLAAVRPLDGNWFPDARPFGRCDDELAPPVVHAAANELLWAFDNGLSAYVVRWDAASSFSDVWAWRGFAGGLASIDAGDTGDPGIGIAGGWTNVMPPAPLLMDVREGSPFEPSPYYLPQWPAIGLASDGHRYEALLSSRVPGDGSATTLGRAMFRRMNPPLPVLLAPVSARDAPTSAAFVYDGQAFLGAWSARNPSDPAVTTIVAQ